MSELGWASDLHATLKGEVDARLRSYSETAREFLADALVEAVAPHIEAAYQRGLTAGRSQQGYSTRRKKKEDPCTTDAAGAAGSIPASRTGAGDEPPAGAAP